MNMKDKDGQSVGSMGCPFSSLPLGHFVSLVSSPTPVLSELSGSFGIDGWIDVFYEPRLDDTKSLRPLI